MRAGKQRLGRYSIQWMRIRMGIIDDVVNI